jgi:hypothetical protein
MIVWSKVIEVILNIRLRMEMEIDECILISLEMVL